MQYPYNHPIAYNKKHFRILSMIHDEYQKVPGIHGVDLSEYQLTKILEKWHMKHDEFEWLLEELRKNGIIEGFKSHTSPGANLFWISLKPIENFTKDVRIIEKLTKLLLDKIESIGIRDLDGQLELIINNDFTNPIKVNSIGHHGKSWQMLLRIAKEETVPFNGFVNSINYLNHSPSCMLYKKTGLSPTKFLEVKNGYIISSILLTVQ